MTVSRLLSREEVAERLCVPVATLAAWAYRAEGPPYFKVGRFARYREDELETWLETRRAGMPRQERQRTGTVR